MLSHTITIDNARCYLRSEKRQSLCHADDSQIDYCFFLLTCPGVTHSHPAHLVLEVASDQALLNTPGQRGRDLLLEVSEVVLVDLLGEAEGSIDNVTAGVDEEVLGDGAGTGILGVEAGDGNSRLAVEVLLPVDATHGKAVPWKRDRLVRCSVTKPFSRTKPVVMLESVTTVKNSVASGWMWGVLRPQGSKKIPAAEMPRPVRRGKFLRLARSTWPPRG